MQRKYVFFSNDLCDVRKSLSTVESMEILFRSPSNKAATLTNSCANFEPEPPGVSGPGIFWKGRQCEFNDLQILLKVVVFK